MKYYKKEEGKIIYLLCRLIHSIEKKIRYGGLKPELSMSIN
jgi:hypothetical protein